MQPAFERVLKFFAETTNDGHNFEIPDDIFFEKCEEVIVGDIDETINGMVVAQLIIFEFIDPQIGTVVRLQEKGKKELKRIYNLYE